MADMREKVLKFIDIEAAVDHDDGESSEYDTDDFGMPWSSFNTDISTISLQNLWQKMKMQTAGMLCPKYIDGKI